MCVSARERLCVSHCEDSRLGVTGELWVSGGKGGVCCGRLAALSVMASMCERGGVVLCEGVSVCNCDFSVSMCVCM